jgi:glyoxylase-like metal-dependent hydrolase (beta-lactamase superfamily II)
VTRPPFETYRYDARTYVFRQNKCDTYEAPFVYLLVGNAASLLIDTGAADGHGRPSALGPFVDEALLAAGAYARPLFVAHTHGHLDHLAGDTEFGYRANARVIGSSPDEVAHAFGLRNWPDGPAAEWRMLGNRVIDVIATPGHEAAHVALYDREDQLLFTGDSLYPGRIYVEDWGTYRVSVARLRAFAEERASDGGMRHPIRFVLGGHVEMRNAPVNGAWDFPIGSTFQPDEQPLPLHLTDLRTLDNQLRSLEGPASIYHRHFIVTRP